MDTTTTTTTTKEAAEELYARSANILAQDIAAKIPPKLPQSILIISLDGMNLHYHPHASLFKFSVRHTLNDVRYFMPSLTQVFVWWGACRPSMQISTLLDIIAREVTALQLPAEHQLEFLVIKSYVEEHSICESSS